jgi:hypothetical protein
MPSQAWKHLEKYTAKALGGKRLTKVSYGESQPDVVVKDISNPTLGVATGGKRVSMIVECKYSVDQPWQRIISAIIKQPANEGKVPIVFADGIAFWDLDQTKDVLNLFYSGPISASSLIYYYRLIGS